MDRIRRLALLLAAALASVTFAAGVPAAAHADNSAIAINTTDGASVFKFAFAIRHIVGPVVDETNTAVAYSSCTSCSTTAIAIEIVLVEGSPTTFAPVNQAIAVNYMCNLCNTFAAAYQFVIQSSGPVHFTHEGMRELRDIRREIRRLERENLKPFELAARLEPLIARLKKVLETQLVPDKRHEGDNNDNQDQSNSGTVPTNPGDTTQTDTTPTVATATVPTDTTTTGTTTTTPTTTGTTTTTTP
jgi:hypothetical protein